MPPKLQAKIPPKMPPKMLAKMPPKVPAKNDADGESAGGNDT